MYNPEHFEEVRPEAIRGLIAEHPLGILVTQGPDGLAANHIPFLLEGERGSLGTLIGHVARKNEAWHNRNPTAEGLVIFQGPSAYVSPNWYPTKRQTQQVVPTYNYAVVHAYGAVAVHEDAKWLRGLVGKLTKRFEAAQAEPWRMGDAPAEFLDNQLVNIVGIEISISRIIAKWKVSQNRPIADREGVVAALGATDDTEASAVADLVEERIPRH